MFGIHRGLMALAAVATLAGAAPARATQLCGWMTETVGADDLHEVTLWLKADGELSFFYKMAGKGFYSDCCRSYSPGKGTYSLHAGKAEKPWGFGSTLSGPAEIDIVAEIHAVPKSVFDDDDLAPILATFTFKRHVPEDETKAPTDFAKPQCATVPAASAAPR